MSEVERMKAELKRWQKEQEKIERVNKELGKIDASLAVMREPHKPTEEPRKQVQTVSRIIHICVPCRRKFKSLGGLQNHFDKSEAHMVLYTLENQNRTICRAGCKCRVPHSGTEEARLTNPKN
eukprot:TRINITY_DN2736_c0_g2_i4.p4 TRINITY_DN2736_c0_g2~~TRINITY_DN2736_c0_g2_i4.p4  ORF type:complete len:123 (-),score=34.26 TRINITY_DN2736_c0_g2_i4:70-438(-)